MPDRPDAMPNTQPQPANPPTRESVPWHHTRPAIVLALLLLYPVGLVLLVRSPRPRRWEKALAAIGFLPLFVAAGLVALIPYWDFYGEAKPGSFRLDFTKGWWQDRRVERDRARQRARFAGPFTPSPEFSNLSWPAFRGAGRDGVVADAAISLDWQAAPPHERWRQPVGAGYAAFVLGNGRLYTIEQRREKEAVTCYDAATGRELWVFDYAASFEEKMGGNGPRATPTLDGDALYALGAEGDLNCLDAITGARRWGLNILASFGARNLEWGLSASPLVVDGKVIVTNSGLGGGSILAFDAASGALVWKNDLGQQGYTSPMLVTLAGRRQILNVAGAAAHGLDPDTGALLWSHPWQTAFHNNCAQPVLAGGDRVFLSSGYGHGCALIRVADQDGRIEARELWSNTKMKNKFSASIVHDGFIYGLDEKILACLDLETGRRLWKGGRYGHGSILRVGGHLLVLGEFGELALLEATPQRHHELARIPILEGRTWNNPALAGGVLFARNHKEMVCYDLRPPAG